MRRRNESASRVGELGAVLKVLIEIPRHGAPVRGGCQRGGSDAAKCACHNVTGRRCGGVV